jgi:hypothetical protein
MRSRSRCRPRKCSSKVGWRQPGALTSIRSWLRVSSTMSATSLDSPRHSRPRPRRPLNQHVGGPLACPAHPTFARLVTDIFTALMLRQCFANSGGLLKACLGILFFVLFVLVLKIDTNRSGVKGIRERHWQFEDKRATVYPEVLGFIRPTTLICKYVCSVRATRVAFFGATIPELEILARNHS